MGNSIYSIRKKLNLSLTDMADFFGVSKSWVFKVETTRSQLLPDQKDKIAIVFDALLRAKKGNDTNPWLKHNDQCKKAEKWLTFMRETAEVKAATMTHQLEDMRAEYAKHLSTLNQFAALLKDPHCTKDIAQWVNWKAAVIAQKAELVGPMAQAKLILKRDEVLGRQYGDEIVTTDLIVEGNNTKKR